MTTSVYNNTGRILSPAGMKTVTTANGYIGYYKSNPVGFGEYAGKSTSVLLRQARRTLGESNFYLNVYRACLL